MRNTGYKDTCNGDTGTLPMKDMGKRLCLPYLWVEQPKPQSGPAAEPCTQGEAPLGPRPGRRGGRQEQMAAGGFPSKPASSELAPLPHSRIIFQRDWVGLGCLRLLRTALVPLVINQRESGACY